MRKFFLSSAVLLLFSLSILIFQLSCSKEAEAQSTSTCSQTATVNVTVTIPASKTVSPSLRSDNSLFLRTPYSDNIGSLRTEYLLDMRTLGAAKTKTFTFENVIPGQFIYYASFRYGPTGSSICGSPDKQISIQAGQVYNLEISAGEFPCQ